MKSMTNREFELTISPERASQIMGSNFFGAEKAIKHLRADPTPQQLAVLSEVSCSEEMLEQSKNSHLLVAIFPLSILEIRGKVDSALFPNQSWYNKESFAKEYSEANWQLVLKTPLENSTSQNWQEQQALLNKNDEVSSAQVMVYTIIGHYLATGERLFKDTFVRTSSTSSKGRVDVGRFGSGSLFINPWRDDISHRTLGLATSRKL